MKILFISDNFSPEVNAAASRVYERACYWVKQGHEVTVITCAPNFPQGKVYQGYKNKFYQVEDMQGIRVVRVKTFIAKNEGIVLRTLDFISFCISASIATLFQDKPDLVVATSPQFFAAIAGWLGAKFKRVPYILELADLWPASISAVGVMKDNIALRFIEKIELFLYRQAKAIIALTQTIKDDLVRRHVPEEKVSVIRNGVDLTRYAPQAKSIKVAEQYGLKDKFIVGYIGTHGMAQALENVLMTAKILKNNSTIKFLFVGEGAEKKRLITMKNEFNLDNVTFVDSQAKSDMPDFWSICDVALVNLKNTPLFAGAIPSKIFEAMGMGLPLLVAAPKGEATVIIEQTNSGLCVEPENPEALAAALLQYQSDELLRLTQAKNSHLASQQFTRENQANAVLNVLVKANQTV